MPCVLGTTFLKVPDNLEHVPLSWCMRASEDSLYELSSWVHFVSICSVRCVHMRSSELSAEDTVLSAECRIAGAHVRGTSTVTRICCMRCVFRLYSIGPHVVSLVHWHSGRHCVVSIAPPDVSRGALCVINIAPSAVSQRTLL